MYDSEDSVDYKVNAQVQLLINCSGLWLSVKNNCGNANLSGVKAVRREVDQEQGSKGVCCSN